MFTTKKVRHISVEEMNKVIKHADAYSNIVVGFSYEKRKSSTEHCNHSLTTHSYLIEKSVNIEFTTKYGTDEFKACTYICRLDGEVDMDGGCLEAYRILRKYYKEPQVKDFPEVEKKMPKTAKGSYLYSAGPAVGFNPVYDRMRHEIHIYDINSAYATQMIKEIPDLTTYRFYDIVKPGEIGFLLQEGLPLVPVGYQGDIVMKLIDSPYKEFAKTYYARKKAGDKQAKVVLNHAVGFLQRRNPFIRAYIIHNCNKLIESLMDENTVMWNTDAIYSITPRNDLKIGTEIGEWKYEYHADFAHVGNNYQKDRQEVSYRHVAKKWFGDKFDILVDELPTKEQNIYKLKGLQIVKR